MKKIIIAAVAKNGVIGYKGKIPWYVPNEQKFFRSKTINHALLMGRKTLDSLESPLENRLHLVLSKSVDKNSNMVKYFSNSDLVEDYCKKAKLSKIYIIGGGEIFRQYVNDADEIILSEISLEPTGDTYFPEIDKKLWLMHKQEEYRGFYVSYYKKSKSI